MNIIQIYKQFPTTQDCLAHLESVRWGGVPECPYCTSDNSTERKGTKRYHCNTCNNSYSVTVGTVFHKTRLDLQKWFLMISLMLDAKKSMSARQMARHIEINKDTAHKNMMKLRVAMREYGQLFAGIVELDETFIGGKNKNRHFKNKIPGGQGGHSSDKTPVFGMLERGGRIKAVQVKDRKGSTLKPIINKKVSREATVMTDEHTGYNGLSRNYDHQSVNHGIGNYVTGNAHTNSIESFWSLFKRGYMGQWHHIGTKYLNLYLDEFTFRQNNRGNEDVFSLLLQKSLGV